MKSTKRKRQKRRDTLVLKLLIIVAAVLVIFEGQLVVTMIKHHSVMNQTVRNDSGQEQDPDSGQEQDPDSGQNTDDGSGSAADPSSGDSEIKPYDGSGPLAGLTIDPGLSDSSGDDSSEDKGARVPTVSDPDSPAIVPKAATSVDDSYFSDAVFIGDSRMEGFRNTSGITQGRFFTSVGMSLSKMASDPIIQTADGNITVAAALSGGTYNKIYIMLGANDLGEYDWDSFYDGFISVTRRFREIQPNAIFYICSCIYVEEAKVTGGSYVNNANVEKINSILLQICEEEGYYYLDLNEFLTNGYGSLLEDASSDGVHIYDKYCKQMLEYLKSHYVESKTSDAKASDAEDSTEGESETEGTGDKL